MQLRLSFSYIITFLLLTIVMLELHEIVHITVGRLICGCWGHRDFNVWELCEGCGNAQSLSWLATLAGPLFSFSMMWIGMGLLNSVNLKKRALGFSLIFANIPFGRVSEAMKGAGDEMVVTRYLLKDDFSSTQMIVLCSIILLMFALPPIISAFNMITNKRRWLYLVLFLTLPLIFLLMYVLTGLNSLLNSGFLSAYWIMGTPLLITLHTLLAIVLLIVLFRNLFSIADTSANNIAPVRFNL